MQLIEAIGLLAAVCTTGAYLPQAIKSWRSRSTKDVSWALLVLMAAGVFLWLAYGLMTNDFPVTAANAATEVLVLSIAAAKAKYG